MSRECCMCHWKAVYWSKNGNGYCSLHWQQLQVAATPKGAR